MIPNHINGSRNQVEVTRLVKSIEFWNQESNFHYYFCKFQFMPIKYYHVICKSLLGKSISWGHWNQIINQAKILHDSESH